MKIQTFKDLQKAVKSRTEIIEYKCGQKDLVLFAVATYCANAGISTTLGVITSAGVIAAGTAVPTGGISILLIIASAATIIAIVAILNNTDYELSIDWKNMTITLKLKKHN